MSSILMDQECTLSKHSVEINARPLKWFALAFSPPFRHIGVMIGKDWNTPAFTYAEVETALAAALGVGLVHQRGALRGRLKHFQRLGLVDIQIGKGRRAAYSRAQAAQWLIALILAETGLDPVLIVATIKKTWKGSAPDIERSTSFDAQSGNPAYLFVEPRALTAPWEGKAPIAIRVFQMRQPHPAMPGMPFQLQTPEIFQYIATTRDSWLSVYNLTRAMTRLDTALPPR
jgi:hypothetical protein